MHRFLTLMAVAAAALMFANPADAASPPPGCDAPDYCEPPVNPYLADSPWPITHRNSYAQDSSALPGPTTASGLRLQRLQAFPAAITLAYGPRYSDGSYPVWGSGSLGVYKAVQNESGIRQVDQTVILPDVSSGLFSLISGAYSFVDRHGSFFAAGQRVVRKFRDAQPGKPNSKIAAAQVFDIPAEAMEPGDLVAGMALTYDGQIIIVSKRGTVMALGRGLHDFSFVRLPNEEISNSVAIDEDGGIYIVSEKTMRRVQWTGSKLSLDPDDGAWAVAYDPGPIPPAPGRLGPGSGTTPTLLGAGSADKLVAIADGGSLMHVNYFWRSKIPDDWPGIAGENKRLAAKLPIKFGDASARRSVTDQSLVGRGYDVMAVSNTYGFPFNITTPFSQLAVFFSGNVGIQPFGVEKFSWDPTANRLVSAWANKKMSCPNGIPAMSASAGLAYCWGSRWGWWTLEAFDWNTGASVFNRAASYEAYDNSVYAGMEIGPFGTAATGTLGGANLVAPRR
jgi:hypothetical protein